MSDVEKFKLMDVEEIFKKTYIPPKIIQCLKEEDFCTLCSKNRAIGFISIIEKRFGLDLSELREKAEQCLEDDEYYDGVDIGKRQKRGLMPIVGKLALLAILIGSGYYFYTTMQKGKNSEDVVSKEFFSSSATSSATSTSLLQSSSSSLKEVAKSEVSSIKQVAVSSVSQDAEESVESTLLTNSDENFTQQSVDETKAVATNESESNTSSSQTAILPKITIIPKQRLWIGIIYLDNYQKKQLLTSQPVELNTSRDQLIITGHGKLQIDTNGEIQDFNSKKKLRFLYRAGILEVIDKEAVKHYNRGKDW